MQATEANRAYLRPEGLAARCGVSERTIRDWQRRGLIPFYKPSRKITLFAIADVDRALSRFRVQAVGEPAGKVR